MKDKKLVHEFRSIYFDVKALLEDRTVDKSYIERIELLGEAQNYLESIFDNSDDIEEPLQVEQWVTSELVGYLIPRVDDLLIDANVVGNEDLLKGAYTVWEKSFALASRRSFHHFLLYMEMDRTADRQVYANRIDVLRGMTYYLNKMHFEEDFIDLVASFPPGYGKSFLTNYFSAWIFGVKRDNSIIRMSYSDDLLNGFSRSIKELILSDRYKEIFTGYQRHGRNPFAKNKDSDWLLKDADTLVSHYTRTRDGSVTGIRANAYIMFDDMTKGAEEANNDNIHDKYWQDYMTAWSNRKQDEYVKELTIGTMWSPKDILGRKGGLLSTRYTAREGKFPYTTEYVDENEVVRGVIIRVPMLDENHETTCRAVYSTEKALEIKEETDPYLFSCVYQQEPIAAAGRLFAYENLRTYDLSGSDVMLFNQKMKLNDKAYAALDPVRKGKDLIAMPIFRVDTDNPDDHFLIDVLFKGKSMDEVYDDIVDKIIVHKIVDFVIENNIDVSLKSILTMKLQDKGYYGCNIIEKFSTKNKMLRIKDASHYIVTKIIFPKKGLFPPNSEMGMFMENVEKYSLELPNRHDDAPDALGLYVDDIIKGGGQPAKVTAIDMSKLF